MVEDVVSRVHVDFAARGALIGAALVYGLVVSPYGPCLMVTQEDGRLVFLGFCQNRSAADEEVGALKEKWKPNSLSLNVVAVERAAANIYQGDGAVAVRALGTKYQHRVWGALINIAAGTTCSYSALAKELGSSPRAVGGALAANPISLLLPCHRVLDDKGKLNGYRWGLPIKHQLLTAEGVDAPTLD